MILIVLPILCCRSSTMVQATSSSIRGALGESNHVQIKGYNTFK